MIEVLPHDPTPELPHSPVPVAELNHEPEDIDALLENPDNSVLAEDRPPRSTTELFKVRHSYEPDECTCILC